MRRSHVQRGEVSTAPPPTLEAAAANEMPFGLKFGKLHAAHAGALTDHLIRCRRACDGDLDLFLVMAIIGERTFSAGNAPDDMSHQAFVTGTVENIQPLPINLQSIADFSGIPRETVRRKLDALIAKGWVKRDGNRFVTATDEANSALGDLTTSTLRYLHNLSTILNRYCNKK